MHGIHLYFSIICILPSEEYRTLHMNHTALGVEAMLPFVLGGVITSSDYLITVKYKHFQTNNTNT